MNLTEAREKISQTANKYNKIREITSYVELEMFVEDPSGNQFLLGSDKMEEEQPKKTSELFSTWSELQQILPAGFEVDSNPIRHLFFNQASDWLDISTKDIPRKLVKVEEYKKKLSLIEYLDGLHPEIGGGGYRNCFEW